MGDARGKYLRFFAGGIEGTIDDKEVRKAVLLNLYAVISTIFLISFSIIEFLDSNTTLFYAFSIESIFLIGTILLFFVTKNYKLASILNSGSIFLMFIAVILFSDNTASLFWLYGFPVISIVLVGRKTGSIASAALLVIVIYLITTTPFEIPDYYKDLKVRFIATYISVFALMLFSEYIRYLTNKSFFKTNIENSKYMVKINIQRDEMLNQKEELEALQPELEKLSIVARETDNAVAITDKHGNYEWINGGYEKMFGYKLPELIETVGKSIFDTNSNEDKRRKINKCINEKVSVSFETQSKTKENKTIWTKKELTPVLDENGELKQLIAIDSEITKIKKVQRDIIEQHEEISAQKTVLESKNAKILENKNQVSAQNEHIKSGITYASTIQKASLISTEQIGEHFENFVYFQPKEIVSGDFYWFSVLPNNKFCFAIADNSTHGVPGAFISLLTGRLLSEIVIEEKEHNPEKVLEALIEKGNKLSDSNLQASIFFIDRNEPENIKLSCSSNSKMLVLKTLENKIELIENTNKKIKKGDTLYLFSDGISLNTDILELITKVSALEFNKQLPKFKEKTEPFSLLDDLSLVGIRV